MYNTRAHEKRVMCHSVIIYQQLINILSLFSCHFFIFSCFFEKSNYINF
jgi:hypothetical protein